MDLSHLGWDANLDTKYQSWLAELGRAESASAVFPARVAHEHRLGYRIWSQHGEQEAMLPSAFKHKAASRADWPAVGDWVVVRPSIPDTNADLTIAAVLPRQTCLRRSVAGARAEEQVLAANINIVFVVMGLDDDFSLRRLERYLALVADSGAKPVVVLNKVDLCSEFEERIRLVQDAVREAPIHASSATEWIGVEVLRQYLAPGQTVALIGSSGVGKSTLINDLVREIRQSVGDVRARDGRGQHTTVARDLIHVPAGGLIIDNPGIREIQLPVDENSLNNAFPDIVELAGQCRFNDCTHHHEPGCAIRSAIEDQRLDPGRLDSFFKLRAEIESYRRLVDDRRRSPGSRRKTTSRRRR